MIKFEKRDLYGFETAIRGMRNPKNSWDKSDSAFDYDDYMDLGPNDLGLAKKLANAGTDHGKFLRFIIVSADITAPLYWWKEFDTYRMGVEKNSCSTMHKLMDKKFELDDFSHDRLYPVNRVCLMEQIAVLNRIREQYLNCTDTDEKHDIWDQAIQLLPSSYNQKRTCLMSYAALRNMYHARKNHPLLEWREFCRWVEYLPYAKELIIGE